MTNLILVLVLSLSSFSILPITETTQEYGVYETYEDYINGNLKTHETYVLTYHRAQKFRVKFEDENGEKIVYRLNEDKIWGYVGKNYQIYRVSKKGTPYVWIEKGKINIYTNYHTIIRENGNVVFHENQFGPQFSLGDNAEMIPLTKNALKEVFIDDYDQYEKLKKTKRSLQSLYNFIVQYNKSDKKKKKKDYKK